MRSYRTGEMCLVMDMMSYRWALAEGTSIHCLFSGQCSKVEFDRRAAQEGAAMTWHRDICQGSAFTRGLFLRVAVAPAAQDEKLSTVPVLVPRWRSFQEKLLMPHLPSLVSSHLQRCATVKQLEGIR